MSIWGNGVVVKDARKVPASDLEFFAEVASGNWFRLHGSFYIRQEDVWELPLWRVRRLRVIAVDLQVTSDVLVGKTAAVLWDFRPLEHEFVIELAYPQGRAVPPRRSQLEGVRYRRQHFAASHTVLDVCRWDCFAEGLVAAEAYLRAGHSAAELQRTLDSMGKMHGRRKTQRVFDVASGQSRSAAESWAKAQLIEMGVDFSKVKQNPKMKVGERSDFRIFSSRTGW